MLRQPLLITYWLPKHPVFLFTPKQLVRQPLVTYPSLHFHPTFAQSIRSPLVTYPSLCFPPNTYLRKQRISLGVRDILTCAFAHMPNLPLTKRGILVGSRPLRSKDSTAMEPASCWL